MSSVVRIEVPIGDLGDGRQPSHVATNLKGRQREALKRLTRALDEGHARLANGNAITKGSHAVCWLLEQYAAGLPVAGE